MKERDRLAALASGAFGLPQEEKIEVSSDEHIERFRGILTVQLRQAGISMTPAAYVGFVAGVSVLCGAVAFQLGAFLGIFLGVLCAFYLLSHYLDERASKRSAKVIPHLPPFIDGLAAALATGFNIESAIVEATNGIPPGVFRDEMNRVVQSLNRGFTIEESIGALRQNLSGKEIISLCVALNLFATIGGHLLEPFRRLARKIRDQQQVIEKARRDLVIVKQAFSIIFFLSIAAPAGLLFLSPDYLGIALSDPTGRVVLQFGVFLVVLALILFKKMTHLKF